MKLANVTFLSALAIAGMAHAEGSVVIPSSGQNPAPTQIQMPGNAVVTNPQNMQPAAGSTYTTNPQQPQTVVVRSNNAPVAPVAPTAPAVQQPAAPVAATPTPLNTPSAQAPVMAQQPAAPQVAQPVAPQPIPVQKPVEQEAEPSTMVKNTAYASPASAFQLATVSASVPKGKASLPKGIYKTMDDDSWRQIELIPASNRNFIDQQIQQVIKFKQQSWNGSSFSSVWERPEAPTPLAEIKYSSPSINKTKTTGLVLKSGTVSDGFSIADTKSGWFLYGQKDKAGVLTSLAVSPDDMPPSENFAKILAGLAGSNLIMVDWYKDQVVDTSSANSILSWAETYKPSEVVKN